MTAERLLKVYEQISEAPDAIARLRRFVLDLAVRGKLVEQDAGDEPATRQLVRIAEAKSQLDLKERKTKKKAFDPSLTELAFDLPLGWDEARLSDLVRVVNGRAYKKSELLSEGTPVLRVGNLFTSDYWYYSDLELEDDKYCDEGDLIYAWSASFGPFIWSGPRAIFHYHIWKLPLFSEKYLSKNFVYLFLQQKTREIKDAGHGISMIHMTKEKMEQLAVPVPPIAEQHRIVAKVDELMALCDRLEEDRKTREETRDKLTAASLARLTAPDTTAEDFPTHANFALETLPALTTRSDQIKTLRQTILNLAVRGKLVEQNPADEPASAALKRIAEAREEAATRKSKRARGLPTSLDTGSSSLPDGWESVRLSDIAISMRYGTSTKCGADPSLVPVLRIPNVSSGRVTLDDMKFGPLSEKEQADLALAAGDLLMIRSNGSLDIVGRSAVVSENAVGMAFAGYLVRLRTDNEHLNISYIWLAMNSQLVRDQIEKPIRSAVGLKNVNLTEFGNLSFWLPPLAEQHRIVAKVDTLMALCDRLEAALATTDTTRTRLLEALLHEALEPSQNALEAAE